MNQYPPYLKAIETEYDGHLFRSRLEARWAVFFNAIGIPYEYEKEGFELGDAGRYLPDFWLPVQDCWVEIKGEYPTNDEIRRAELLETLSNSTVFIFYGQIEVPHEKILGYDEPMRWCECPKCGMLNIIWSGLANRLSCYCLDENKSTPNDMSLRLITAYKKASQARFEFNNKTA